MTDEREEADLAGRTTERRDGRDETAPQEDARNPSTDQRENAIELSRPAV